jgi:hypothetical protein
MKLGFALGFVLAAGCAVPPPPAPPPSPGEDDAADLVGRLRVEREYRPAPTGAEPVGVFYELPRGAYIAQGWCVSVPGWGWGTPSCWTPRRCVDPWSYSRWGWRGRRGESWWW